MSAGEQIAARLSVIVISYNVRELVLDCLGSVCSAAPAADVEVIVVDNASSDGTVVAVRKAFPFVTLIENANNRGFPSANNQALRISSGGVVLLLNPDTRVARGTLAGLMEFFSQGDGPMIAGLDLRNPDGTPQSCAHQLPSGPEFLLTQLVPWAGPLSSGEMVRSTEVDSPRRVGWVSGAALAMNRDALNALGALDEDLFWAEDLDIGLSAAANGIPVFFLPGLSVTHLVGQSGRQNLPRMLFHQHVGRIRLMRKHFGGFMAGLLGLGLAMALAVKIVLRTLQCASTTRRTEAMNRLRGYVAALRYIVMGRQPSWIESARDTIVRRTT